MRKFLSTLFKKIGEMLEKTDSQKHLFEKEEKNSPSLLNKKSLEDFGDKGTQLPLFQEHQIAINEPIPPKIKEKQKNISKKRMKGKKERNREMVIARDLFDAHEKSLRDFTEMMENPFLSLSKTRKTPIFYESQSGLKIKVSPHTGHYLASIYDFDIIIFVAKKMQEILNNGSDIPPRTITFPRHEILKTLQRHNGKKEEKDLKSSLARLKLTGIETTLRNEDNKYDAGFGFLDSWKYVERTNNRDVMQIQITLSQWLFDGICAKGSLLKVSPDYFSITSALKRFLYRTARKHVGNNDDEWEFSIKKLYEKSGSESELKVFKNQLKKAVIDNDIPDYSMKWTTKGGKTLVTFHKKIHNIDEVVEKFEKKKEKQIEFN